MKGRENNLDLIRFIAASMVIYCHAFPLTGNGSDQLFQITGGQIHFGGLAVGIFFIYAGALICKSAHRLKTFGQYFKARICRILPPLAVVTIILAFLVGPMLTTLPIGEYFKNSGTYRYLLNSIFILQHNLPGVFAENVFGTTVNGVLWTLPVEFLCYIMCFFAYRLGIFKNNRRIILGCIVFAAGCAGVAVISMRIPILFSMIQPMGLFAVGMLYYIYWDKIPLNRWLYLGSILGLLVSTYLQWLPYTIYIFFPYFIMYLGFGTKIKFSNFAKYGEVSYGMYLTAWPIQQILNQLMPNGGPYSNFVIAWLCSIVLGWLICKFVERPISKISVI